MCRAVTCTVCNKTTWAGCGLHIDSVRQNVPADQWCEGHPRAAEGEKSGFLSRLLRR